MLRKSSRRRQPRVHGQRIVECSQDTTSLVHLCRVARVEQLAIPDRLETKRPPRCRNLQAAVGGLEGRRNGKAAPVQPAGELLPARLGGGAGRGRPTTSPPASRRRCRATPGRSQH